MRERTFSQSFQHREPPLTSLSQKNDSIFAYKTHITCWLFVSELNKSLFAIIKMPDLTYNISGFVSGKQCYGRSGFIGNWNP